MRFLLSLHIWIFVQLLDSELIHDFSVQQRICSGGIKSNIATGFYIFVLLLATSTIYRDCLRIFYLLVRPAYSCPGVQRTALRLAGVAVLEHVINVEAGQAGGHRVPASELHQAPGRGHEHLPGAGRIAGPRAAGHIAV